MALPASAPATVCFGPVDIRNRWLAGLRQILTYPHPSVKLTYTQTATAVTKEISWLHRDHLGRYHSRAAPSPASTPPPSRSSSSSAPASQTLWAKQSKWLSSTQTAPETKGWILGGEQSFIPSAKRAFSKVIHAFARNPQKLLSPLPNALKSLTPHPLSTVDTPRSPLRPPPPPRHPAKGITLLAALRGCKIPNETLNGKPTH